MVIGSVGACRIQTELAMKFLRFMYIIHQFLLFILTVEEVDPPEKPDDDGPLGMYCISVFD